MTASGTHLQDFGIKKDDVPYLSRGYALWAQMIAEFIFFAVMWATTPAYFPGIIEAVLGIVFAVPVGLLYSRVAIVQARAAAARSRQEAGPAIFPFSPDVGVTEYITAVIGAFVACLLLVGATYVVYLAAGPLQMPWAHFNTSSNVDVYGGFPYDSVISASTAYFLVNVVVVQHRMMRWYNKLPG